MANWRSIVVGSTPASWIASRRAGRYAAEVAPATARTRMNSIARSINPPRLGARREMPEPTHSANSPLSTARATASNSASSFWSTSLTVICVAVGAIVTFSGLTRAMRRRHSPILRSGLFLSSGQARRSYTLKAANARIGEFLKCTQTNIDKADFRCERMLVRTRQIRVRVDDCELGFRSGAHVPHVI